MTDHHRPTEPVTIHELKLSCKDGEHDWSGPGYEHVHEGGSVESGCTCAKCGMEFGHFMLHTFD